MSRVRNAVRGRRAVVGLLLVGSWACGGDNLPQATTLELASGDAQEAPAGGRLADPLAVLARDATGATVTGAQVRWSVVTGSGATLSDQVTVSDGTGQAQVRVTLGAGVGTYGVRAALVRASQATVSFQATATAAPAITSVSPSSFAGGDMVTIAGSAFPAGSTVQIGGVRAPVTNRAGTGDTLSVIAPFCLPGGAVEITVHVSGASSNAAAATYVASSEISLPQAGYVSIPAAAVGGCAHIEASGAASRDYLLIAQAGTGTLGASGDYRLLGDSGGPLLPVAPAALAPLPYALRFHDWLRAREAAFARTARPPGPTEPLLGGPAAAISAGQQRSFRVCGNVECSAVPDFRQVTAQVRYVGQHLAIYVDVASPGGGPTPADLSSLGSLFDDHLYEIDARAFGAESDIDRNGRVIVLMTPVVNGLTPKSECQTSVVTGFFFAIDIDPAYQKDQRSNHGEVFYTIVPDPNGEVTCTHSFDRVRRLVPVTFIHEFQHMISYNQHVLVRNGDTENLWLNEGMSHLAEELGGDYFLDQGDELRFSQFALGDIYNAFLYLRAPGSRFLTFKDGTGSLEERGAAWLFLRWLVDRYGDGVTRSLEETQSLGASNVEVATGETFSVLVADWLLANYVSDYGAVVSSFATPVELQYTSWRFRQTYGELNNDPSANQKFNVPFPLTPPVLGSGGFTITGTLHAGSGDYFLLHQDPGHAGMTLTLTMPGGVPLDPSLQPRLTVIRLQ